MWFYAAGGAAISVFGPSVESISEDFDLTYSQISLIITVMSVGFIAGSLAGGAASDRWGRRAVLVPSAAGAAISMFWFAASPTFGSLLAAGCCIGASFGPGLAAATALIADLARQRSTRALNLFNTAFALGAIVAPAARGCLLGCIHEAGVSPIWLWPPGSRPVPFSLFACPTRPAATFGPDPFAAWSAGLTSPLYRSFLDWCLLLYVGRRNRVRGLWRGLHGTHPRDCREWPRRHRSPPSGSASCSGASSSTAWRAPGAASSIVRWSLVLALVMSTLAALAGLAAPLAILGFVLTGATIGGVFPTALGIGLRLRPEMAGALAGGLDRPWPALAARCWHP